MAWLANLLAVLATVGEALLLWLKRKPQLTLVEQLLERRRRVLEAQHQYAELIGSSKTDEIRKKLNDIRARLDALQQHTKLRTKKD